MTRDLTLFLARTGDSGDWCSTCHGRIAPQHIAYSGEGGRLVCEMCKNGRAELQRCVQDVGIQKRRRVGAVEQGTADGLRWPDYSKE